MPFRKRWCWLGAFGPETMLCVAWAEVGIARMSWWAVCDGASKPEPDVQGRVPAGSAAEGLWCNVSVVSHFGVNGGFKVQRYVDAAGHECAYYDTALLFPLNALNVNSSAVS